MGLSKDLAQLRPEAPGEPIAITVGLDDSGIESQASAFAIRPSQGGVGWVAATTISAEMSARAH